MKKSLIFISVLAMVVIMITGCPGPQAPGSDAAVFSGMVYENGLASVIDSNIQYWNGGPVGFEVVDDPSDPYSGSLALKVDYASSLAWSGVAFETTTAGGEDLSSYDAMTFWAKIAPDSTSIDNIGLANGSVYQIALSGITYTSTWAKYVLPLPDASKLTNADSLFFTGNGNTGVLLLDDIQYETLGTVTVSSVNYGDGDIIIEEGQTSITDVPNATINDGSTDITVTGNIESYMTWSSNTPSVASVDSLGRITGETAGSAIVTGSITGAADVVINVTVTVPVAFNGPIYDDLLKNGFSAGHFGTWGWFDLTASWHDGDMTSSTESVFEGTSSTKMIIPYHDPSNGDIEPAGGNFFEKAVGTDVTTPGYTNLVFALDLSLVNPSLDYLKLALDYTNAGDGSAVNFYIQNILDTTFMTNYAVLDAGTGFTVYTIPLADITLGTEFSMFRAIGFWDPSIGGDPAGVGVITQSTIYVDDIKFTN